MDVPLGGVGGAGRQVSRARVAGPVLTILATEDGDGGTYRCYANNTEGVAVLQASPNHKYNTECILVSTACLY